MEKKQTSPRVFYMGTLLECSKHRFQSGGSAPDPEDRQDPSSMQPSSSTYLHAPCRKETGPNYPGDISYSLMPNTDPTARTRTPNSFGHQTSIRRMAMSTTSSKVSDHMYAQLQDGHRYRQYETPLSIQPPLLDSSKCVYCAYML
jgi:hypothetical protein